LTLNDNVRNIGFPIKTIVYATDFLESSRLALDYAVGFAHRYDATLVITHAIELSRAAREVELGNRVPSQSRKAALDRLAAFAIGIRSSGIKVSVDLRDGDPCGAVLSSAVDHGADLIVLGTHGVHRGLDHLLIGSNTEKILLSATCPTLTIGRHVMGGIGTNLRFSEVLLISDFTAKAAEAVPYALAISEDFGVPLELCHMLPDSTANESSVRQKLADEYCEAVSRLMPDKAANWCDPHYHLQRIYSSEQILERAELDPSALIMLGVETESTLRRHLHTSFAYQLLAKATCPLVTIRGAKTEETVAK
jgi:nucleotide-binding universal stress UspA family protein